MIVKRLTEHLLEFQSLKGGCTGSCESTLVKMPHCWKSHVTAHFIRETNTMDPDQTAQLEQSDQGPYCLQYKLHVPKNINRRLKREQMIHHEIVTSY